MNDVTTSNSATEKRDSVRVEVPLDATYSCDSPPVKARIQDLSEHGLFLDTSHALAAGSMIDIAFDLPDGGQMIETHGQVAWSAPMMGCGVRFVELPDEDRKRIKFFVAEVFFGDSM